MADPKDLNDLFAQLDKDPNHLHFTATGVGGIKLPSGDISIFKPVSGGSDRLYHTYTMDTGGNVFPSDPIRAGDAIPGTDINLDPPDAINPLGPSLGPGSVQPPAADAGGPAPAAAAPVPDPTAATAAARIAQIPKMGPNNDPFLSGASAPPPAVPLSGIDQGMPWTQLGNSNDYVRKISNPVTGINYQISYMDPKTGQQTDWKPASVEGGAYKVGKSVYVGPDGQVGSSPKSAGGNSGPPLNVGGGGGAGGLGPSKPIVLSSGLQLNPSQRGGLDVILPGQKDPIGHVTTYDKDNDVYHGTTPDGSQFSINGQTGILDASNNVSNTKQWSSADGTVLKQLGDGDTYARIDPFTKDYEITYNDPKTGQTGWIPVDYVKGKGYKTQDNVYISTDGRVGNSWGSLASGAAGGPPADPLANLGVPNTGSTGGSWNPFNWNWGGKDTTVSVDPTLGKTFKFANGSDATVTKDGSQIGVSFGPDQPGFAGTRYSKDGYIYEQINLDGSKSYFNLEAPQNGVGSSLSDVTNTSHWGGMFNPLNWFGGNSSKISGLLSNIDFTGAQIKDDTLILPNYLTGPDKTPEKLVLQDGRMVGVMKEYILASNPGVAVTVDPKDPSNVAITLPEDSTYWGETKDFFGRAWQSIKDQPLTVTLPAVMGIASALYLGYTLGHSPPPGQDRDMFGLIMSSVTGLLGGVTGIYQLIKSMAWSNSPGTWSVGIMAALVIIGYLLAKKPWKHKSKPNPPGPTDPPQIERLQGSYPGSAFMFTAASVTLLGGALALGPGKPPFQSAPIGVDASQLNSDLSKATNGAYQGSGVPLNNVFIMHISNSTAKGAVDDQVAFVTRTGNGRFDVNVLSLDYSGIVVGPGPSFYKPFFTASSSGQIVPAPGAEQALDTQNAMLNGAASNLLTPTGGNAAVDIAALQSHYTKYLPHAGQ